jgi:hypothetical protein
MTSEGVTGPPLLALGVRPFCNRLRVRSLAGAFQPSSNRRLLKEELSFSI